MRAQAIVEPGGKTATGIHVPDEVVEGLGAGQRPAIRVMINGYRYRSTIASMGGRLMLPLSAEHRAAAGVAAGDTVTVDLELELELDTESRDVTVPPDLAAALDQEPDVRRFFDGLSYSTKRRHVLAVEGAKTPETRQGRLDKAVATFRDGRS